jgi:TRAP-type C4-dicarboxylate transport system substrate-binding protein/energy-coupling factor transporter ATP-binding protein EcfA2
LNSPTDGTYLARALQQQTISIRGARTHNLKNIDLDIPRNQLVVITGLSGSGKSSLAFDTLYAEGQRRYVESLSTYARQFLQLMDKPDVDVIEGLSPAISIEQKTTSHNPRSTVGTVTEIHDYLRLLFARAGTPYCPEHDLPLQSQTVSQMVDAVLALPQDTRLMILAPVAREKKGEFLDVFAEMQAQGYVRFRVNGAIYAFDDLPTLKKTEKHDIDVVIDRVKVRADLQQRLAESFEAALRLANGRAIAVEMEESVIENDSASRSNDEGYRPKEHFFNAKFACPVCNHSISELEPRLFSFNSPVGACPSCDGLGQQDFFDPARVVAFPTLSLASGAIKGWDRRNGYYFSMLESLAKHYKFDIDKPFESLPPEVQTAILQGSGEEEIKFSYVMDSGASQGKKLTKKHPFEGILPNMARRYRETDSALVREDLARYRSTQPCQSCNGSRLRLEARHVKIGEGAQARAIFEISRSTLRESYAYFQTLTMHGAKGDIAAKVVREIGLRLKFLNDVGLNYLSLDRSAETLSGGESQRIRLASQIGSGLTGVMYVLDEPSIGLHQRDNDRLIETLKHLRDIGNSVLVVEHDEDMMRAADHIIDMGLGAGVHGGRVIAQGNFDAIQSNTQSLTGQYLAQTLKIAVPGKRTPWLPTVAPKPGDEDKFKSRNAPSPAAVRRAEREAHHRATQGALQTLRVVGASDHNLSCPSHQDGHTVDARVPTEFGCGPTALRCKKASLILNFAETRRFRMTTLGDLPRQTVARGDQLRRIFLKSGLLAVTLLPLIAHPSDIKNAPLRLRIVGGLAGANQFPRQEEPFWQKTLPALSRGQITTEIVPFDKAGIRTHEMLRLMQLGVVPFGTMLMGGILSADPELAALDLAGMNPNMAALRRSVAAFRPHLEQTMRERHGIEVLAIYAYPAQVTFCSRSFTGLADLAGRRVRISNPSQADLIRPFGAVPIQSEFSAVVSGMRSGNVDCAITGAMSGNAIGLQEVASHLHTSATTWGLSVFGANLGAWTALPPDMKSLIKTELPKLEAAIWADSERQTDEGVACNTGRGSCLTGKTGLMKEVQTNAVDESKLRISFRDSVLPAWVQRCGNTCVPVWNRLLAPVTGIRAETQATRP